MSAVVPLDPASPAGMAAAERLSQAFAEIKLAIWERMNASPRPSVPPKPKPNPSPRPPKGV